MVQVNFVCQPLVSTRIGWSLDFLFPSCSSKNIYVVSDFCEFCMGIPLSIFMIYTFFMDPQIVCIHIFIFSKISQKWLKPLTYAYIYKVLQSDLVWTHT